MNYNIMTSANRRKFRQTLFTNNKIFMLTDSIMHAIIDNGASNSKSGMFFWFTCID